MSCVWVLQRGHSGDGCDLFVLSWAMVRRVRRGSNSSELLICGGDVRSILLLPVVARCLETIDVYIWRMLDFMSVVVTVGVCGNVSCVVAVDKDNSFFLPCTVVVCCKGCDGCCVLCLYCDAWSCRCSCMGSMSVSSCRCCMFVSCVHHVAVSSAAFCMTCSFVNAGLGCKRRQYGRDILQSRSHVCLLGCHECLLFIPSCCGECFYYV